MAEELDDGEFWLPSQFLTEEDILTDFDILTPTTGSFNSDLASPADLVTETESDEEELLAELTRQMALSPFLTDCGSVKPKGWVLSGSPQSTLCPLGGVRGGGDGSSHGSPTGRVSPPPAPAAGDYFGVRDTASLDLLSAAAGEVAKIRMMAEQPPKGTGYFDSNRALLIQQRKVNTNPNFRPSHQQLQAFQFQQLWNQESVKPVAQFNQQHHHHHRNRPLGLSPSAWPPLQHNRQLHPPPTAVMRPVFPVKRESAGTGVFLPRSITPTIPRKINNKPESNGKPRGPSYGYHGQRRKSGENARPQAAEIQLPSEWTY